MPLPRPMPGRARGFTLIELLVAVTVMAVLATIAWRGLSGMQETNTVAREHTDTVLRLEAGLAQWGADLDAVQALPQTTPMDWDGGVLRITRRQAASAIEANTSRGVLVVAWTRGLRQDAHQWLRWQSQPVSTLAEWQSAWQAAQLWAQNPSAEARTHEVALGPLEQWQVYYFRGSDQTSNATAQSTSPDSAMPDGVRLVLTIPAPHPLAGTVTRDWARGTLGGTEQ